MSFINIGQKKFKFYYGEIGKSHGQHSNSNYTMKMTSENGNFRGKCVLQLERILTHPNTSKSDKKWLSASP